MGGSGRVQIEISQDSADALANVAEMKTSWAADPTMVRGAKRVRDRQDDAGHAHGHVGRKKQRSVMTLGRKRKHEQPEAEGLPTHTEPLTHADYRKNSKGEKAIRRKMDEILALDAEHFPTSKSFDPDTSKCRLKADGAQDLVWDVFLEHAPACLTCLSLVQHLFRIISVDFKRLL